MKKVLLTSIFALVLFFSYAQCDIQNGSTVSAGSPVSNGDGSTTYTFTLLFDLADNNGNKYTEIFL